MDMRLITGTLRSEQARPAFIVLAVVAVTAAAIALAGQSRRADNKRAGARAERPREADPSGADR